jgi:RNA polymerase primary sigma factor
MKNTRFETADGLPQYFKSLDALSSPLTKAQEHELAAKIQAGDERALNQLVTANLKFVVTLANKFIGMGLPIDDLIQEGNLGLIEAASKFTADKDVKFITYAQFWIRKRLNLALCEHGRTVRLPVNQEYAIYKQKMAGESVNLSNIEIDRPVGEDGDNTLGDLVLRTEAFDPFADVERDRLLNGLLNKLKASDREIVELFYGLVGDGLSTKEIASQVGKTPAEVNRALKVARAKMKREAGLCKP